MKKTAAPKKSSAQAKPASKPKAKAKAAVQPKKKIAAKPAVKAAARKPVALVKPPPPPKKLAKPLSKASAQPARKASAASSEPMDLTCILPKKELEIHRNLLLRLRERIVDEIKFLANDSLNRSQKDSSGDLSSHSFHMADQGTDNFDREFAANLLSSEQDVLYEIDEALRRVDLGTYGICEMSGKPIEKERLKFLPFARYSVAVQSEMERGKPRYRPFRRTSIQTAETQT